MEVSCITFFLLYFSYPCIHVCVLLLCTAVPIFTGFILMHLISYPLEMHKNLCTCTVIHVICVSLIIIMYNYWGACTMLFYL